MYCFLYGILLIPSGTTRRCYQKINLIDTLPAKSRTPSAPKKEGREQYCALLWRTKHLIKTAHAQAFLPLQMLTENARAREEAERRIAAQNRRMDHLERARREEEAPLLEKAFQEKVASPITLPLSPFVRLQCISG